MSKETINNPSALAKFPNTTAFGPAAGPTAAWTDLDLSAIVGTRQVVVLLSILNSTGAACLTRTRKNGEANPGDYEGAAAANTVINTYLTYLVCVTDSAGIIEWIVNQAGGTLTIKVEAFWYES